MKEFVKKRLDEITKVNLYDIGLSEEELKRRKNKKYELKKALKGCTYGDVNDKKYVKELIFDLLAKEYGVTETNISKAIPFDIPSLLTAQDKFDILIYAYKKEFGYEALTEMIKKYDLANHNPFPSRNRNLNRTFVRIISPGPYPVNKHCPANCFLL